jgi:hypothetical protein
MQQINNLTRQLKPAGRITIEQYDMNYAAAVIKTKSDDGGNTKLSRIINRQVCSESSRISILAITAYVSSCSIRPAPIAV